MASRSDQIECHRTTTIKLRIKVPQPSKDDYLELDPDKLASDPEGAIREVARYFYQLGLEHEYKGYGQR